MMLKKFKYNDIQQCHFLNNKNNIKLYYTYKKNKYFINLEKNTSTQSFILEINSAERSFSTVKLKGVISAKMVKIIKFLFFAQKVSSGMGALRPKFLGG